MNENMENFNKTKCVGNYFQIDENSKKFAVPRLSFLGKIKEMRIFNYNDLVDYELIEDGKSISKGGVGRAIVGGVAFGAVGAVVGGSTGHKQKGICTKMQIRITVKNSDESTIFINLITASIKKESMTYSLFSTHAQKIISLLEIICDNNENETKEPVSVADEIIKLKHLLDEDIISKEEFEEMKKRIINM